jgi:hypothetical protein
MWITGTRFPELLFLENKNLDTGTGKGIFNQGIGNRGFLEHVPLSVTQARDLSLEEGYRNKT